MNDDLLSLEPNSDFTRREFVVTTLAAGFALAVQPVSADTITTDTKGLEAGEVKIPTKDGEMPAYLAVAPELYARQGDVSKISDIQEIISKVVSKVPDAQVMADLDATVDWAK